MPPLGGELCTRASLYAWDYQCQPGTGGLCKTGYVSYTECMIDSLAWMASTVGDHSENTTARLAGINQSTLNRQVRAGTLTPETVVAIARAYRVPVLPGLVACGLITEAEAALKERMGSVEEVLATAEDSQIVGEMLARLAGGKELHSMLTAPLDGDHPVVREAGD